MSLITVEAARARILTGVGRLPTENVALADARGRYLAADIAAMRDQPPFAASAMDGWAVRAGDTPGRLGIVGESGAGHGFAGALGPGEAVRIFTGAALPAGADTIVIQEEAQRDGDHVMVSASAAGRFVRGAGLDFRAGDGLLRTGERLDAWRLALAAAAGFPGVPVARRPRVAILSTGEEVIAPGGSPDPFQIFDSATTALRALVESWGGECETFSVGDDRAATARAVAEAGGDVVVTLGGASVGDHDVVKPALAGLGLSLGVDGVAMRPGKPTWFGLLADGRRVVGLPGNPASAMVCAALFLRPLLVVLQGGDPAPRLIAGRTGNPLAANGPREHWMRARLEPEADGVLTARAFSDQDSSLVTVFAQADGLIRRAAKAPPLETGAVVDVLPLERL